MKTRTHDDIPTAQDAVRAVGSAWRNPDALEPTYAFA